MNQRSPKIDGYVQSVIERYSKEFGIDIDPVNPTREQRLRLALEIDKRDKVNNSWYAMEIMVCRRIDSSEMQYAFLITQYLMFPQDARKFYDGFPEP